jgi:antitoxin YokJ
MSRGDDTVWGTARGVGRAAVWRLAGAAVALVAGCAMTELEQVLEAVRVAPGCSVAAPRGLPEVRHGDCLPIDLIEFYSLCGGVSLFGASTYPIRIVEPSEFVRANPAIVGADCPDDISDYWYIVARGGLEEAISIDCNRERLGRCYDSFWDRHGVVGSCRVVALSLTELLRRLFVSEGEYWYWLANGGPDYGDAYDRRG